MPFLPPGESALLASLFKQIPDTVVFVFDVELRCTFAGGSALVRSGFGAGLEGQPLASFFSREDEAVCRAILLGEAHRFERFLRESFFVAQGWPVKGEDGKITAGVLFFQDKTEFKKNLDLLEQRNNALKEALSQVEEDKQRIKKQVTANIQNVLMPLLEKLKIPDYPSTIPYVELIEKSLRELTSAFGMKIAERFYRLTPKEIQICSMIKNGLSSREIGRLLNISEGTIESHRNHIRRKLDIAGKTVNLATYLQTFDGF